MIKRSDWDTFGNNWKRNNLRLRSHILASLSNIQKHLITINVKYEFGDISVSFRFKFYFMNRFFFYPVF